MSTTSPVPVAELIARARSRIEHLSPDAVAEELARGDALVVDLREPAEIETNGTIEGALHVPRGMLEFRADPATPYHLPEFRPARRIILFCASGGRSALAAETLGAMGYTSVAHLDGGFAAWARRTEG